MLLHNIRWSLDTPSISLEAYPLNIKKTLLDSPTLSAHSISSANLMETRVYHEINVILALAISSGLYCRSKSKDFH